MVIKVYKERLWALRIYFYFIKPNFGAWKETWIGSSFRYAMSLIITINPFYYTLLN